MGGVTIRFKLCDLRDIEPWGKPDNKRLHWFGLTDGCYCIEIPIGKLLEHNGPADSDLGEPWCEYQVARLFEDILECWPILCDPMPPDIIDYFTPWYASDVEPAGFFDATALWLEQAEEKNLGLDRFGDIYAAIWGARAVYCSYLRGCPKLRLWRVGSDVYLVWEAEPPWVPSRTYLKFSVQELRDAVAEFCKTFLSDMGERVALILRNGWCGAPCDIDVPGLAREQIEREQAAIAALSASLTTDWDQVRRWMTELDSVVQKS